MYENDRYLYNSGVYSTTGFSFLEPCVVLMLDVCAVLDYLSRILRPSRFFSDPYGSKAFLSLSVYRCMFPNAT